MEHYQIVEIARTTHAEGIEERHVAAVRVPLAVDSIRRRDRIAGLPLRSRAEISLKADRQWARATGHSLPVPDVIAFADLTGLPLTAAEVDSPTFGEAEPRREVVPGWTAEEILAREG